MSQSHATQRPSRHHSSWVTVAAGFNRPIYATHAGDGSGRLFLLEQSGKVWILRDGARDAMPFLDVSNIISRSALGGGFTEQGLLGLAFHPNHADNGVFFINYTDLNGDTIVARYLTMPTSPTSLTRAAGRSSSSLGSHTGITTAGISTSVPTATCISRSAMAARPTTRWARGRPAHAAWLHAAH